LYLPDCLLMEALLDYIDHPEESHQPGDLITIIMPQ
jgi:hypothetical protein